VPATVGTPIPARRILIIRFSGRRRPQPVAARATPRLRRAFPCLLGPRTCPGSQSPVPSPRLAVHKTAP